MEQTLLPDGGMTLGVIFILSCVISYFAIPIIKRVAEKQHLFDHPDDHRKLHSEAVPTLGGIAICAAFLVSFSVSPWANSLGGYSYLAAAVLILFFVGLKDDLVVLSASKKLVAQLTAAGLIIFGSDMVIDNFYGVFGLAEIPFWVAVPITFFTVIVLINAINLIDGIDGLAGGIGVIASVIFGAGFLYVGQLPMAMFSFCLVGALLGFLYYNFSPASIFMGDTGSMLLGFLLAVQTIEFVALSGDPLFASVFGNASAILPVAILGFPLFDTLRVVVKRMRRSNSIFQPGQDHVHHELLRMGLSHSHASLLLYGQSLLLVAIIGSLALLNINVNILLGTVILTSLVVFPTNGFKRKLTSWLFGYDWQAYQKRKWGIEFNPEKLESLNGGISDDSLELVTNGKEAYEEESESVAV
ncbi:undecaprenyl-phosphate alpha-N-acetylglucosaminyl 1-phosphate transferase [Aliifodinibius salipaludis]|uniref:Undecaprenyl-phosphate alpha-N-acetylglucosaminyl 1-phosphate transferase n=1 Tax=Fodinibius salipaludis TaxID=2032627 RepID=A0A2A2G795_9BACT|nr:MraY family glycosyltransferase [Aliifodinibius salipaludis]PAU93158.1 undecaprenyl-phosphate alpha-N-acetylglucosaminyl 1-phosphate transferase [Aliifodinibius salipaludis]